MQEPIWISIRDGQIVGTPFGPDVPNGKYLLVAKLDSEGGGTPQVVEALCQYRDDLKHPPDANSRERRIAMVEKILTTLSVAATPKGQLSELEEEGMTAQTLQKIEESREVENHPANVDPMISMIERVALNPQIPIERLESLLTMKERLDDRAREAEEREQIRAYHRAMAVCQSKLKVVAKNKANTQTNSKYADLAALSKAVDPVIHDNGFSLSFSPAGENEKGEQLLEWTIAHSDGHIKTGIAALPTDKTGAKGNVNKTDMHAFGSAATYGRRYLKLMLFDIATGDDDDGNAAGSEAITEKQLDELIKLADDLNVDKAKFCTWAEVDSFAAIRRHDFFKAKSALLQKGKKVADNGDH